MRRRASSVHPFLFLRRQLVPVVPPDKVSLTVVFQSYVLCYPKHIITLLFILTCLYLSGLARLRVVSIVSRRIQ